MKQERFIVRSRAVFTGLTDRPVPAAIAVEGQKIRALLPWDCGGDYGDWEIRDYGDRMIMPSFGSMQIPGGMRGDDPGFRGCPS